MNRLKNNQKGVAGFFEDLPTLIVVLLATALFISSLLNTVITFSEYKENEYMRDSLNRFVEEIRGWDHLVLEEEGQFIGDRVTGLDRYKLEKAFNTSVRGHQYRVVFDDRSSYPQQFNNIVETQEPPRYANIYTKSTTVTIVDEIGNEHLSVMIVSIWI